MNDIREFIASWSGLPPEAWSDHAYSFHDEAAVRHLFRVAAGLDSAVLGEGEILRQVRTSWEAAHAEQADGPTLAMLFRLAAETGKRVRAETQIAQGTTSLSHAAVAMASERLGSLAGRTTLLVGAGEMGEAMATALSTTPAAGPVLVANRTWDRATALAARCGGRAVQWGEIPAALERADVLLTSTGSPEVLIEASDLDPVLLARQGRPLLVVDIAVPRDVDPSVGTLPGVTVLDMDDLKRFAERAMAGRRGEIPAAERIVAEEIDRYLSAATQREVAPVVATLHERGEAIRQAEMARLDGRLADLDDRSRRAVEALSRGIVAKLLHEPTVNLKAAAGSPGGEQLARALRQLFDL
jgi:glutamyl-tRNA reductase